MAKDVIVRILGDISDLTKKLDDASGKASGFGDKLAGVGKVATAALGGAVVAVGSFALKMGSDLEDAHASLQAALIGASEADDSAGSIRKIDAAMEKFGFTNAETETALAHSVVSTQNLTKSMGTMGLAADLAKFKHIDLTSATDILDKALTGNLKPLKALAIDLPVTATNAKKLEDAQTALTTAQQGVTDVLAKYPDAANAASKGHAAYESATDKVTAAQKSLSDQQSTSTEILDALTGRLKGQAASASETFSGKVAGLKAKFTDLAAQLGEKMIPIIEQIVGYISDHLGVFEALAAVVGVGLVIAVGAYVASMVVAAAATVAATWPILAVVAAVGLVIAIGSELGVNWKQLWTDVQNWIRDAWNAIALIVSVGAHGLVDVFLGMAIAVVTAADDAFGWVPGLGGKLDTARQAVVDFRDKTNAAIDGITKKVTVDINGNPTGVATAVDTAQHKLDVFLHGLNQQSPSGYEAGGSLTVKINGDASGLNAAISQAEYNLTTFLHKLNQQSPSGYEAGGAYSSNPVPSNSSSPISGKATGGPVRAGMAYTIGEKGSETFVPSQSGTILPHGAGGATYNSYMNVNQADEATIMMAFRKMELLYGKAG